MLTAFINIRELRDERRDKNVWAKTRVYELLSHQLMELRPRGSFKVLSMYNERPALTMSFSQNPKLEDEFEAFETIVLSSRFTSRDVNFFLY